MLVLAPGAAELPTLFLERAALVSVGSQGLSNIVGIALCLSLLRLDIPIEEAIAESASKESSAKCFLHKTLCFVGPLQESRVLFTSLVHFSRKRGSDGNLKRLTPSLLVLEQPAAMQYCTISERKHVEKVTRSPLCEFIVPLLTSRVTQPTPEEFLGMLGMQMEFNYRAVFYIDYTEKLSPKKFKNIFYGY